MIGQRPAWERKIALSLTLFCIRLSNPLPNILQWFACSGKAWKEWFIIRKKKKKKKRENKKQIRVGDWFIIRLHLRDLTCICWRFFGGIDSNTTAAAPSKVHKETRRVPNASCYLPCCSYARLFFRCFSSRRVDLWVDDAIHFSLFNRDGRGRKETSNTSQALFHDLSVTLTKPSQPRLSPPSEED